MSATGILHPRGIHKGDEMNTALEDAKKKLRSACVDFSREAIKSTGDGTIAVLLLAKAINDIIESFTKEDFPEQGEE